jgi:hypothetical protein
VLTATVGASTDELGYTVGVSGRSIVVGAPFKDNAIGGAYVFRRRWMGWRQQAELRASDGLPGNQFGFVTAISGPSILVGTFEVVMAGEAYVFVHQW